MKREPLVYIRARHSVQKKKKKNRRKKEKERLGQYISNNKLIHEQYTGRHNLHLSHTLSLSIPPSLPPHSLSLSLTHTTASQMT